MNGGTAFLQAATTKPSVGAIIGIVAFFVAIIGLALWSTFSAGKAGAKKIKEKYGDRIIAEGTFSKSLHYFFTADEFLAQKYNAVFAIYRLSDIRFIGSRWDTVQRKNVFFMTDAEGSRVKPVEVVGGTKSARKMFGDNLLSMNKADMETLCKMILKYAPHVRFEEK